MTLDPRTKVIAGGRPGKEPGEPLNVPIQAASNFRAAPAGADPARMYSREDGTRGTEALEAVVGDLEGGDAVAFSSGMAAVAAVLDLVPAGAHVAFASGSYQGVTNLLADGEGKGRWRVEPIDVADTEASIEAAGRADLLWIESPTNPMLDVADLPALCAAGNEAGAIVGVDNTFATPLRQNPLALGAGLSVHSATKFIGGHSDLLLGIAVAREEEVAERLREHRALAGAVPGALETFLALRGIRTLGVRLDQGERSAADLARRLSEHPAVTRVRYAGLPDDPGHDRAAAQSSGFGAVLAFELGDADAADRLCDGVSLIQSATSLGGVESTMERRGKWPGQEHVPPGLVRLSVGCEHVDDLWADLEAALPGG